MYYKLLEIIDDVKFWFKSRFIKRYHLVDTKLKPGYYDKDKLMLHACFSLLEDYVDIECANLYRMFEDDNTPQKGDGLRHIEEMIDLYKNGNMSSKKFRTDSVKRYTTIKNLYLWWTIERPQRIDPFESIKISMISRDVEGNLIFPVPTKEKEEEAVASAWKLTEKYEREDTDKLIQLMRVRPYLWT